MLHLFNSCYVYPQVLFDPTCSYVVIGKDYKEFGLNVDKSFYHSKTVAHNAIGRFRTLEDFLQTNVFEQTINNKERYIIYCDDEELIKLYTAFMKTQVSNITAAFFVQSCRLFYLKLKTRAKLIPFDSIRNPLNELADKFLNMSDMPAGDKLPLDSEWIKSNCGIEWKLAVGKTDKVEDIVNRYVYSYFDEAKSKFLSRKDPAGSWVENKLNNNYNTVPSFSDLYLEIRKEVAMFTDPMVMEFYRTKNASAVLDNPKFLMLLTANKNMADKIDIWMLRWCMTYPKEALKQLGILA